MVSNKMSKKKKRNFSHTNDSIHILNSKIKYEQIKKIGQQILCYFSMKYICLLLLDKRFFFKKILFCLSFFLFNKLLKKVFFFSQTKILKKKTRKKMLKWIQDHPFYFGVIVVILLWIWLQKPVMMIPMKEGTKENFSTCYQLKQFYLNSVDPEQPTGFCNALIEKQYGKYYIDLQCSLAYALGGDFHTSYGAYTAFFKNSKTGQTINLGNLTYTGQHWYRLRTDLNGDYTGYDTVEIWRQEEDFKPKKVLTGKVFSS